MPHRYRPSSRHSLRDRATLGLPEPSSGHFHTPPHSGRSSPFDPQAQAHAPSGHRYVDDLEGQNDEALEGLSAKVKLLKDVRASTLINKSELKSHIQVINSVKDQLDRARRNLVGPLIRSAQSNSFGLESQLEEVDKTYGFLKGVRDTQKYRVLRKLWGTGEERRVRITQGKEEEEPEEISGA